MVPKPGSWREIMATRMAFPSVAGKGGAQFRDAVRQVAGANFCHIRFKQHGRGRGPLPGPEGLLGSLFPAPIPRPGSLHEIMSTWDGPFHFQKRKKKEEKKKREREREGGCCEAINEGPEIRCVGI